MVMFCFFGELQSFLLRSVATKWTRKELWHTNRFCFLVNFSNSKPSNLSNSKFLEFETIKRISRINNSRERKKSKKKVLKMIKLCKGVLCFFFGELQQCRAPKRWTPASNRAESTGQIMLMFYPAGRVEHQHDPLFCVPLCY